MRTKILAILKNSNNFISGEEISSILGISRAAVWKHINMLKKQGYEIEALTNKGYKLKNSDKFSKEEIEKALNTKFIGKKIFYYECVDSTNIKAKENFSEPEGTVFIADCQKNGRGRLSRSWESEPMCAIYMSVLLKPQLPPGKISQITLVAGLAVLSAIEKFSDSQAYIKWPNDILMNDKKICGILTELTAEETCINYAVVGIGINVNNKGFDEALKNKATSLFIENKKSFDRSEIVIHVLSEFERYYTLFLKNGFSCLLEEYKRKCITLGKDVEIITPTLRYHAKAVDIDEDGGLIIKRDKKLEIINSGEVSVRGIYGYI